ncbi:MAG: hypothetical protein APF76_03080 [Desulfitibacter sp. BRH_c19]|nr:MAG: hypothetical protein APF76_03080 [Desulfitibacter sp. BRH_c19]
MAQESVLNEKLLLNIFNRIYQGILVLSSSNTILAINSEAENLLNVSQHEVVGRNLKSICPELVIEGRIINGNIDLISGTKINSRLVQPDKTSKRILFLEYNLEKGDIDILENVINSIDEAVMVCDNQGKLIIYNEANQRLDGLSKEQVIGKHVTSVYGLSEETSLLILTMKQRQPIIDRQQSYTTFTGRSLNIMCNTYPLFKESKIVGAVSIQRDYSKIKELSDKIIELQEQLFESSKKTFKAGSKKSAKYVFNDIVGNSAILKQTITLAKRVANTNSPILIYGETGTGKELFAQSVHNYSKRASEPFIAINCAAIPENLLEGILFGTVKGAYTGAVDRPGLFEQARDGTLLLDEINSMGLGLQAKLLRVLQEGAIRRVGAADEVLVDVRVITNVNIEPTLAIEKQLLREDLFYRLGVVYLKVPSLRYRKEDIPILVKGFIAGYNKTLNKKIKDISPRVMELFLDYSWPGNVRELQHAIESAMNIMHEDEEIIALEHLPHHMESKLDNGYHEKDSLQGILEEITLLETMGKLEKEVLLKALERNNWNVSRTAKQLNIKRQSLQYRIKKYEIK